MASSELTEAELSTAPAMVLRATAQLDGCWRQWQRWRSQPHALEMAGRETLADVHTRVAGALEELFVELVDGRAAAVFTHDAAARAAVAWTLGTGP